MTGRIVSSVTFAFLAGLFACSLYAAPAEAADLRPGFEDRLVKQVLQPTSMDFTPDGRMLVTTQPGLLQVYDPAKGNTKNVLDLRNKVCANGERGLLGVTVDPKFESNRYVYLYYTFKKHGVCPKGRPTDPNNPVNRVARYVLSAGNVATFDRKLVDNIPSPNGNHNGGDLHFGKDGYLYVSVGDGGRDYRDDSGGGGENDASRDRHVLLGKILRVTRDGRIPAGNPYASADNGVRCGIPSANGRTAPGNVCKETFARGLRNPFRMAFDPDAPGTRFNINDVGQNAWEEIDRGKKGADYAWNLCEGTHDNPDRPGSVNCGSKPYTPPIHEYNHSTGCSSVTGAAFVPDGVWPAYYEDSYLFGDYVCGKIFRLTPKDGGGYTKTAFATGLGQGGPVAMTFGPSGRALYYTTYAGGDGGQIRRISYAPGNLAPNAAAEANPPYATSPGDLTMDFDGTGSTDPDGDPLTYEWDFNYYDTSFRADPAATGPTPSHTYASVGKKTAALRVTDDNGGSEIATVVVFPGDTPPQPTIESPTSTTRFEVGQKITLRGSATDAEDGAVPDAKLTWKVIQHHDGDHTHPFFGPKPGNGLTFNAPAPEDLLATNPEENYLEIRLSATDSFGLTKTTTVVLRPDTVNLTFRTQPLDLRLRVNGRTFGAPRTIVSWVGYDLNVTAPRQRDAEGRLWGFESWSDGRAATHVIDTPADPKTYKATFRRLRR